MNTGGMIIESYKLVLLPMWITTYRYKNERYAVAVNGQSGTWPVKCRAAACKKRWQGSLGINAIVTIVLVSLLIADHLIANRLELLTILRVQLRHYLTIHAKDHHGNLTHQLKTRLGRNCRPAPRQCRSSAGINRPTCRPAAAPPAPNRAPPCKRSRTRCSPPTKPAACSMPPPREVARLDPDSDDARLVSVTRRDYEKARKVPAESGGRDRARHRSGRRRVDAGARPIGLETVQPLPRPHRRSASDNWPTRSAIPIEPYDALLDQYEPDMKTARGEGRLRCDQARSDRSGESDRGQSQRRQR